MTSGAKGERSLACGGEARLLAQHFVAKPWGRAQLPSPFAPPKAEHEAEKWGELWFDPPPEQHRLLVKYLFTSEKLSVQVHPADHQAQPGESGKEECWLVLDAEPGAQLAIGFRERYSRDKIRAAAEDGSIEEMLAWHEVSAGDFFYIPAGTVHAIGAGITLIEVQQNSDTTYRLYDYGRPRALHLDAALAVLDPAPHDPALRRHIGADEAARLVDGPYFSLDQLSGADAAALPDLSSRYDGPLLLLPLEGEAKVSSADGDLRVAAGGCALAPNLAACDFSAAPRALIARAADRDGGA